MRRFEEATGICEKEAAVLAAEALRLPSEHLIGLVYTVLCSAAKTCFVSCNRRFQVLIHLDTFWALTNVSDDKIHVMGEQTSQALVTCVWSHSVWKVHTVELFTNVASVVVLVCVCVLMLPLEKKHA